MRKKGGGACGPADVLEGDGKGILEREWGRGGRHLEAAEGDDAEVEREAIEAALLALFREDRELHDTKSRQLPVALSVPLRRARRTRACRVISVAPRLMPARSIMTERRCAS